MEESEQPLMMMMMIELPHLLLLQRLNSLRLAYISKSELCRPRLVQQCGTSLVCIEARIKNQEEADQCAKELPTEAQQL